MKKLISFTVFLLPMLLFAQTDRYVWLMPNGDFVPTDSAYSESPVLFAYEGIDSLTDVEHVLILGATEDSVLIREYDPVYTFQGLFRITSVPRLYGYKETKEDIVRLRMDQEARYAWELLALFFAMLLIVILLQKIAVYGSVDLIHILLLVGAIVLTGIAIWWGHSIIGIIVSAIAIIFSILCVVGLSGAASGLSREHIRKMRTVMIVVMASMQFLIASSPQGFLFVSINTTAILLGVLSIFLWRKIMEIRDSRTLNTAAVSA